MNTTTWTKFDSGIGDVKYTSEDGRFIILRPRTPSRTGWNYALYLNGDYVRHFATAAEAKSYAERMPQDKPLIEIL